MTEVFGQELMTAAFAVAFLSFFAGFALGRRRGKKEGFAEGLAYGPLELRRRTWEEGRCVICGSTPASDPIVDSATDVEVRRANDTTAGGVPAGTDDSEAATSTAESGVPGVLSP